MNFQDEQDKNLSNNLYLEQLLIRYIKEDNSQYYDELMIELKKYFYAKDIIDFRTNNLFNSKGIFQEENFNKNSINIKKVANLIKEYNYDKQWSMQSVIDNKQDREHFMNISKIPIYLFYEYPYKLSGAYLLFLLHPESISANLKIKTQNKDQIYDMDNNEYYLKTYQRRYKKGGILSQINKLLNIKIVKNKTDKVLDDILNFYDICNEIRPQDSKMLLNILEKNSLYMDMELKDLSNEQQMIILFETMLYANLSYIDKYKLNCHERWCKYKLYDLTSTIQNTINEQSYVCHPKLSKLFDKSIYDKFKSFDDKINFIIVELKYSYQRQDIQEYNSEKDNLYFIILWKIFIQQRIVILNTMISIKNDMPFRDTNIFNYLNIYDKIIEETTTFDSFYNKYEKNLKQLFYDYNFKDIKKLWSCALKFYVYTDWNRFHFNGDFENEQKSLSNTWIKKHILQNLTVFELLLTMKTLDLYGTIKVWIPKLNRYKNLIFTLENLRTYYSEDLKEVIVSIIIQKGQSFYYEREIIRRYNTYIEYLKLVFNCGNYAKSIRAEKSIIQKCSL